MIARIYSAAVVGLGAELVETEADITNGLPATIVVGLPDTAVQESRERVKAAIKNSGCFYPPTRVSVNLAPADVPKLGTQFDLPIALAILSASEQVSFASKTKLFLGELSLDGQVRPVPGVLAAVLKAKELKFKEIFVPRDNAQEAALVSGLDVFPVTHLKGLLEHLLGGNVLLKQPAAQLEKILINPAPALDMSDIAGQEQAKRALEIAAAGGHNVLM